VLLGVALTVSPRRFAMTDRILAFLSSWLLWYGVLAAGFLFYIRNDAVACPCVVFVPAGMVLLGLGHAVTRALAVQPAQQRRRTR
jgi:hypothetical protein